VAGTSITGVATIQTFNDTVKTQGFVTRSGNDFTFPDAGTYAAFLTDSGEGNTLGEVQYWIRNTSGTAIGGIKKPVPASTIGKGLEVSDIIYFTTTTTNEVINLYAEGTLTVSKPAINPSNSDEEYYQQIAFSKVS
jgi:hypothetical protein